jgi:hypothetical protein
VSGWLADSDGFGTVISLGIVLLSTISGNHLDFAVFPNNDVWTLLKLYSLMNLCLYLVIFEVHSYDVKCDRLKTAALGKSFVVVWFASNGH